MALDLKNVGIILNKIVGTPILKIAMVKSSSKKFVQKIRQRNSPKKFVKKNLSKKFVKKISQKNRP